MAIVLGCITSAPVCRAAAIEPGATVKQIEFRGLTRTSPEVLKGLMKTQEGEPFKPEVLSEDQKELFRRGYLHEEVKTEKVPGGIKLIFLMVEHPRVSAVQIKGFRKYRKEMQNASGLMVGTGASDYHLELARKNIEAFLAEKGYIGALISVESTLSDGGRTIVFNVDAGPKMQVKELTIEGNEAFSDSDLQKFMETKVDKWWNSHIFNRDVMRSDLARLRSYYIVHGYPNAEVTSTETLEYQERPGGPEVDADAALEKIRALRSAGVNFTGRVELAIHIKEGQTYKVREVNFTGNKIMEARQLLAFLKLKPGEMFSNKALGEDIESLEHLYKTEGRGRAGVIVNASRSFALKGNLVDINFDIREGPVYYVRSIRTRGNYKTLKRVILRESDLRPGDVYDAEKVDDFKQRLVRLKYFKSQKEDDISITETVGEEREDGPGRWTDLVVDVEETETGGLGIGGGVGAESGLFANLFFRQSNFDITNTPDFERDGWAALNPGTIFTGAGQKLNLRATPGQDRSSYSMSFEEPWLFDKPYRLKTGLHSVDSYYELYDEDRAGGSVYLGKRLNRDVEAGFSYRLENYDISDIELGSPTDIYDDRGDNLISALKFGLSMDKLKVTPRSIPYTGYNVFSSAEVTGGPFGGDFDIFKAEMGGRKYYTLWTNERDQKHVLATRGRLGASWDWGSDGVPVFERFHAGGGGTYGVRGFEFRGIGPEGEYTYLDPNNPAAGVIPTWRDEPLGGRFVALGGVEYQFPLAGDVLRGVTFFDTGTVTEKPNFDGLGDIRASVGAGVRIFIPAAFFRNVPITIDFGVPILKESHDETELIHFTLGITF